MKPRLLKLMTDYHCNPIWEYSDSGDLYDNPDPETLPLSAQTMCDLRAWADWFDTFINFADPHDSRNVLPEEWAAFDRAGRRLWETLQRELGPGWVVSYFEYGKVYPPGSLL
jgi:hypothetical protein